MGLGRVTAWLALSDNAAPPGARPAPLARGLFVVEFRAALEGPAVLLDLGWPDGRALSLLHDPAHGPSLILREGGQLRRHRISRAPPAEARGTARLEFWVDCERRLWRMTYQALDQGQAVEAMGTDPMPLDAALIEALGDRTGPGHRHPSVLWFGLTQADSLPRAAPWLGPNTPIQTLTGPVPAARLTPGTRLRTLDHGFQPLRALRRLSLPAAGSFAPVVLRRPFFATERDLLVSADQQVLIAGASVEYLTGEEEVLVPAVALADGRVAERDNRRAVTHCVQLDMGAPALLVADGCCLLSRPFEGGGGELPRRTLKDWEMTPLLALLGRTSLRPAA